MTIPFLLSSSYIPFTLSFTLSYLLYLITYNIYNYHAAIFLAQFFIYRLSGACIVSLLKT